MMKGLTQELTHLLVSWGGEVALASPAPEHPPLLVYLIQVLVQRHNL